MRNFPYLKNITIFSFSLIFLCASIFYNIQNTRSIIVEHNITNANNILRLYSQFIWNKYKDLVNKTDHFQDVSYLQKHEYEKFLKESVEFFLQFNIKKLSLYNYDGSQLITTKNITNNKTNINEHLVSSLISFYNKFLILFGFSTLSKNDQALSYGVLGKTTMFFDNKEMLSTVYMPLIDYNYSDYPIDLIIELINEENRLIVLYAFSSEVILLYLLIVFISKIWFKKNFFNLQSYYFTIDNKKTDSYNNYVFFLRMFSEWRNYLNKIVDGLQLLKLHKSLKKPQEKEDFKRAIDGLISIETTAGYAVDSLINLLNLCSNKLELSYSLVEINGLVKNLITSQKSIIDKIPLPLNLKLPDYKIFVKNDIEKLINVLKLVINSITHQLKAHDNFTLIAKIDKKHMLYNLSFLYKDEFFQENEIVKLLLAFNNTHSFDSKISLDKLWIPISREILKLMAMQFIISYQKPIIEIKIIIPILLIE